MSTDDGLTLMAVHAHPDDEASSTGGILARYAREGVRTVLVVCTNGELGDSPNGAKPGEAGHDEDQVVATRKAELATSCALLGVSNLELLGYHDSGMMGWSQNEAPESFWQTPVERAAKDLARLIRRYRPQVIVTYDENGFYGHPDHIQANRITLAALQTTDSVDKLYYPAIPRSAWAQFEEMLQNADVEMPVEGPEVDFSTPDELIAAMIDCTEFANAKYDALAAHKSQTENSFFLNMGTELFIKLFAREFFVRAFDRTNNPIPESDLFGGLRPHAGR